MKRLITSTIVTAVLLSGCADKSKYESEDAKLKEYTINTSKAVSVYAYNALIKDGGKGAKEYIKADKYIEAFKHDIDRSKLSNDKAVLYDDLLRGIRRYDELVDEAKKGDEAFKEAATKDGDGTTDFFKVAEYYKESTQGTDFKKLSELRD